MRRGRLEGSGACGQAGEDRAVLVEERSSEEEAGDSDHEAAEQPAAR